ncbi:polyprenyl synthetase family protein [Leekyejoonella antrihumi]|uniref:Polyprenyl synthetase family protein n=1 Tax=Leekyejoonella antrihumi TaxID=1660198 RepID=A0A563E475_9MICO|nr:polyprenyl synthetase family protein [Leekyejoonella antrihumi]TWP37316.1 polyprenyl synthetase family protein [Leekyejoonella antrihumi]
MTVVTGGFPGATPELAARLAEGLSEVDARLKAVVDHDDPFVARASGHLLAAGGKRLRPLLTLLSSELGTGRNAKVVDAAVGVELTHLASLYHDDVMDAADMRRGVASANSHYDNATAILVGDLLFARASEIVAGLGAEAVLIQAQTFVRLCTGQIQDDRQAPEGADPMKHYFEVLEHKTGSLISTAARYGAMFAGCPQATIDLVNRYGELVGMVFQLADDVLDIASDSADSGKVPGTDLRAGVTTLPVLYVRASTDPGDARLQELLSRPLTEDAEHAEALKLLRAHPAVDQAREHTLSVAHEAADLLAPLGESSALDMLRALPMSLATRSS